MCNLHATTRAQPCQVPFFPLVPSTSFSPSAQAPPQAVLRGRAAPVLEETNDNLWGVPRAVFLTPALHEGKKIHGFPTAEFSKGNTC